MTVCLTSFRSISPTQRRATALPPAASSAARRATISATPYTCAEIYVVLILLRESEAWEGAVGKCACAGLACVLTGQNRIPRLSRVCLGRAAPLCTRVLQHLFTNSNINHVHGSKTACVKHALSVLHTQHPFTHTHTHTQLHTQLRTPPPCTRPVVCQQAAG